MFGDPDTSGSSDDGGGRTNVEGVEAISTGSDDITDWIEVRIMSDWTLIDETEAEVPLGGDGLDEGIDDLLVPIEAGDAECG